MYDLVTLATSTTPTWIPSASDFASVTDTANALAGVVAPVIVSILAVTLGIKMLKKFGNKIG